MPPSGTPGSGNAALSQARLVSRQKSSSSGDPSPPPRGPGGSSPRWPRSLSRGGGERVNPVPAGGTESGRGSRRWCPRGGAPVVRSPVRTLAGARRSFTLGPEMTASKRVAKVTASRMTPLSQLPVTFYSVLPPSLFQHSERICLSGYQGWLNPCIPPPSPVEAWVYERGQSWSLGK